MKIETRNNGIKDVTIITPDDGMILRRKSDNAEFYGELWLGYTYYLGGEKLDEPLFELPEHYEEIPMPEEPEVEEIIPVDLDEDSESSEINE